MDFVESRIFAIACPSVSDLRLLLTVSDLSIIIFLSLIFPSLGLTVVGIDPCPQDRQHNSIVSMHPKFSHLRMRLSGVKRSQLPPKVEWLLCDANISPHSALSHLSDLVCALSVNDQGFCGMFLTAKLGDTAEPIPEILQRVRDIGKGVFTSIGATHLPSNGQEILVVALTEKGVARRQQR